MELTDTKTRESDSIYLVVLVTSLFLTPVDDWTLGELFGEICSFLTAPPKERELSLAEKAKYRTR